MAENSFLDPSPFDSNPSMDASYPPFFDSDLTLDDLPLPADFGEDFSFHDFDISPDFPIEDLLRSPEEQPFPPSGNGSQSPNSNDGSGVSSSCPTSGHQSSDLSRNNGPSSPDSGHSAACSPNSGNSSGVTSQELKLEDENSRWNLKRKQDGEDGCPNPIANPNLRNSKYQRSEQGNCASAFNAGCEEEEKRKARLMRNRESAQLSRQRKKHYVEELEEKVKLMHSTINELNTKISYIMAENANLRQQLGGSSANCPPPGVYPPPPMAPMHFPWIPGYAVRPQGSQVPLVPIPKLKPQQPASASRAKKSESKKNESKVKKVASVSLLGLLFILLFFRSIVPGVTPRYGGDRDEVFGELGVAKDGIFGRSKGSILSVNGRGSGVNSTDEIGLCNGKMDLGEGGVDWVTRRRCETGVDGSVFKVKQNLSETLPALLYVPRNGKHVKINGNLIINSVLASEKAMAQTKSRDQVRQSSSKEGEETGLAIPDNVALALALSRSGREVDQHSNSYRSAGEHQRALASDSEDVYGDNSKRIPADGPLHQWFREGMTGPGLSSGMCTEVFQFDVSPASAPGGIIPAPKIVNTPDANATEKLHPSAHPRKMKNRRIMYPEPIPLPGTTLNDTEHFAEPSKSRKLHDNKSVSSVVVSVLADPREAGDGEGDARISPKSLSRIFVVVLLDSVKYVTYSCGLPFKSSGPHLVD
ncbi:bZIP transcription factor 39-like [Phoenix dactylifera]|uniref:BZIP transcription factor 39-like n=1 Tax=Phoenix dactylifera TaxID=42345 RepID=A0A8B8ZQ29_PHODC|nr:bZIP transcription factor 39-like [Phoenix dactylifera]